MIPLSRSKSLTEADPVNAARPFSKQLCRIARVAGHIGRMSRLSYTMEQRLSLLRAHRSGGSETTVLDYKVSYLNKGSFRIALGEVFFDGAYVFDAGTDCPLILDCGANIGVATLFFKHFYPKARIYAFEADPTTARTLQKNIVQNGLEGVTAYNLMLSNSEGVHPFYVGADLEGSLQMSALPDRLSDSRQILVNAGRLSSYIEGPVDLLKLDVEGSEFDVMTDLRETGKIDQVRRMVIEYHHKAGRQPSCMSKFLQILEDEGFEYQISALCDPITCENEMQDILIGAYRPGYQA